VLDKVVGYTVGGTVLHAAIWTQRPVPASFSGHAIADRDYQRVFDDRLYQSYRPIQVAGYAVPGGARYAAVWESQWFSWGTLQAVDSLIDTFMTTYGVPGLSMAMSNDGRLVFARARGWADRDAQTPLSVRHRMRIASVSKPITAAATMLLAQNGSLAPSDLVFGAAGRLGKTYGTLSYSAAQVSITIDHLLTHLSGYQNTPTDPMFDQPDRDHASLIGWVLDNRQPVTTPGTNYQYLNFGYCLLGRVIERVTGQTYDAYVRSAILAPAGVASMQIAGDTLAARATDEVVYYGQGGEDPYGLKVARMDAHGGWISTPMDLLRFLRVVDGRGGNDQLTAASVTTMTTGTAPMSTYARGWTVDGAGNWDHNGALAGTLSLLRRRNDGTGHAAVINTRQGGAAQNAMMNAFYKLMDDIQTQLGALPGFDLF
jgi:CubicO group peptidase (beta-lactamase class C family)